MNDVRVVAIDPNGHGFGFVVFEGPYRLVDWGHVHVRPCSSNRCLERAAEILSWYIPAVVVTEKWGKGTNRKGNRSREFLSKVCAFSESSGVHVVTFTWKDIRKVFNTQKSLKKYEVARIIASHYPELAPRLPPPRKIWMSEDERMNIFDAAALALTYFNESEKIDTVEI